MTSSSPRIAIVGGGMSGLLAGLRLMQHGVDFTIFEASARAGGAVQTHRQDGWCAELGPTTLGEPHPDVRALLDDVGFADIATRPNEIGKRRFLLHNGVPVPLPSRVADLVASPLLSLSGRLRLLKEPFIEAARSDTEETVASFVRRRLGAEVADRIIDPFMAGSSGGDPDQLLARYVLPKLVEYEQSGGSILKGAMRARRNARRRGAGGSWSCQQGLGQLVDRITTKLGSKLQLNTRIDSVSANQRTFTLHSSRDTVADFDAVLLAIPASAFGQLQLPQAAADAVQLGSMPHAPMAVVSFGFRRKDVGHPLDGFGLNIASSEKRQVLSIVFASSLFPDRTPAGHVLLTAMLGGGRQAAQVEKSDNEIHRMVLADLADTLQVQGAPVFQHLVRWRDAIPQTVAGHSEKLAASDRIEAGIPGLALSGGWRDGRTLAEVMLGGTNAADRLTEHCRNSM